MNKAYLSYADYIKYNSYLNRTSQNRHREPIDDGTFAIAEFRARKRIDYLTDCRVAAMAAVPEAVKLCMIRLIDVYIKFDVKAQLDTPVVVSFSTDGYSENYGNADSQMAAVNRSMDATIREMLYGELDDMGVPLLYRGVRG